MEVSSTIAEFRRTREKLVGSVGFVPTMGYLHEGHLSLVRQARRENDRIVVSIFVNPAQFGPQEDFAQYPRDTKQDLNLLEKEGADVVFMPLVKDMYPTHFSTWVDVEGVAARLEGAVRPGHFRGVATVVAKLFNIVKPYRAYFGQKDAQQAVVIRRMVSDLNMDLKVLVAPTVRELNGLAMSSRNIYLSSTERQSATILWRSLCLAKQLWERGEQDAEHLRVEMTKLIQKERLAHIDYISIAEPETLEELAKIEGSALVSLAVRIGKTRLIDNILLEES